MAAYPYLPPSPFQWGRLYENLKLSRCMSLNCVATVPLSRCSLWEMRCLSLPRRPLAPGFRRRAPVAGAGAGCAPRWCVSAWGGGGAVWPSPRSEGASPAPPGLSSVTVACVCVRKLCAASRMYNCRNSCEPEMFLSRNPLSGSAPVVLSIVLNLVISLVYPPSASATTSFLLNLNFLLFLSFRCTLSLLYFFFLCCLKLFPAILPCPTPSPLRTPRSRTPSPRMGSPVSGSPVGWKSFGGMWARPPTPPPTSPLAGRPENVSRQPAMQFSSVLRNQFLYLPFSLCIPCVRACAFSSANLLPLFWLVNERWK